jgi:hypothetical protein
MKRFWDKVDIRGLNDCWNWQAGMDKRGYGYFSFNKKCEYAHRVSMILNNHNIDDLCVLHKCDNPKCVNPNHLFIGTYDDNNKDCADKGRAKNHHQRKLTKEQVAYVRACNDKTHRELANEFSVGQSTITNIKNYKTYSELKESK